MVYSGEGRSRETTTAHGRGTSNERSKKLRVTFTNVDRLLSSMLEIKGHLNIHRPDVFCIAETKSKEEIHINFQRGIKFGGDRKGKKGGVLIIVQEDICIEGVQYGDGMADVIGITREKRKIVVMYVPPKANTWLEECKVFQKEVLKCLNDIRKDKKILLVRDFNRKDVN